MKIKLSKLNKLVSKKYLSRQKHTHADLLIYNYTHKTQRESYWTPETMMCRGLIVDLDGNIKARPFPKFFNISEHESENKIDIPTDESFRVYEKMDGSLGILYWVDDTPFISTRGSFVSDQAVKATGILRNKYFDVDFNKDYTYLFEIIYPENRIVVDYGKKEDLCLLAVIDTETGVDVSNELDLIKHTGAGPKNEFPVAKMWHFTDLEEIKAMAGNKVDNDEGFVIVFENGLRVKLKYDEYVRLHRLITGVTARRIWDLVRNGQDLDDLIDRVPEEFKQWVEETERDLWNRFDEIDEHSSNDFISIAKTLKALVDKTGIDNKMLREHRREFAKIAIRTEYPNLMFSMLDSRDHSQLIWKMLKPKAEKPFIDDKENI